MPWTRNQDGLARPKVAGEAREGADIVSGRVLPIIRKATKSPRRVARRRRADAGHRERDVRGRAVLDHTACRVSSSSSSEGARDCPCSVREQVPTPADTNQERAGNAEKLSAVTGASRLLSASSRDS